MKPKTLIEQAEKLGWEWTAIELVDAGHAYGYESPDKTRFLTAKELIKVMRDAGHVENKGENNE